MRDTDPTVSFENVIARKETDAALLCEIDGEEVWIAKSQIADDSEVQAEDDVGTLTISEWLAKQKALA